MSNTNSNVEINDKNKDDNSTFDHEMLGRVGPFATVDIVGTYFFLVILYLIYLYATRGDLRDVTIKMLGNLLAAILPLSVIGHLVAGVSSPYTDMIVSKDCKGEHLTAKVSLGLSSILMFV